MSCWDSRAFNLMNLVGREGGKDDNAVDGKYGTRAEFTMSSSRILKKKNLGFSTRYLKLARWHAGQDSSLGFTGKVGCYLF